jgi:hypothetical protein
LTKAAETIIDEDSGASLRKRIVEIEAENSQLKGTTTESTEMISTLQHTVDNEIKDYNLLMEGNKSLLAERNDFHYYCEDLKVELAEVRSNTKKRIADLEVRVKSAEAYSVDVAVVGEKCLRDFEGGFIRDLAELRALYVCNTQTIRGLCSPMPEAEPSAMNYLRWLSTEISGLPDMFGGVNENFVTATVKGALIMVGESIDLDALQDAAADSGADILHAEHDVQKCWHSFGYDYVLDAIRTGLHEVITNI